MYESNEAFVRWQGISLQHLGQTINLLITLSTGLLAYAVNLIVGGHVPMPYWGRWAFRIALLSLLVSIFGGVLATLTRVDDFRHTAQIARVRAGAAMDTKLEEMRDETHALGIRTRLCYGFQKWLFMVGASTLAASICISYWDKL